MSRHRTPIYSFLLALLATPAWAIEPPAEEAAPPAPPAVDEKQPAVQADPVKDVAYLGIVSGPIPKALSVHLGVRNGEGVIVRSVMPEGPAEKAGIQTHDIILTVDDTPAFSPEDLSKAIASKQPDDEVKIGLIQRGEGSELVVRLGKRPDAIAQGPNREDLPAPGIGPFGEELLRNMLNGRMHGLQFDGMHFGGGFIPLEGELDEEGQQAIEEMHRQMRDRILEQMKGRAAPDALLDPEGGELDIEQNAIIRLKDGNGSIEFSTKNGETQLTARDKDNEIEWQGPWNNEEDKAKAPEDIRERAKKLKAGGAHGIHLKFNHGGALVPPRE